MPSIVNRLCWGVNCTIGDLCRSSTDQEIFSAKVKKYNLVKPMGKMTFKEAMRYMLSLLSVLPGVDMTGKQNAKNDKGQSNPVHHKVYELKHKGKAVATQALAIFEGCDEAKFFLTKVSEGAYGLHGTSPT